MSNATTTAAETYWKTDTTGKGHLARGKAFHEAREHLIGLGFKKGEAQKIIADEVQLAAPAHEKKFGAATVSHYTASYALLLEDSCNFQPTAPNADLYAVVHKAYAASMGVQNLRYILSTYVGTPEGREQAIQAVAALSRSTDNEGEGEEKRTRGSYGLKHALAALARIQEHEWTNDEKDQLFTAALATSVAVQPDTTED